MTPLPETPIVILAGSRKLPFGKLAAVVVLGKSTLYSICAMMGGLIYGWLEGHYWDRTRLMLLVVGSLIFSIAVTWKPSRDLIFGLFERLVPRMKE